MKKIIALVLFSGSLHAQEMSTSDKAYFMMIDKLLSHSVEEIFVDEVNQLSDVIWLDARESKEYEVSKIENSIWVGYDDFALSRVSEIEKDKEIIVYCSIGYRSEKIAEKLKKAGYENVKNLYGGIFSWVNQELPIYDSLNDQTNRIHGYSRVWGVWLQKGKKVY